MLLESIASAILISGANYADYHTTRQGLSNGGKEYNVLIGSTGQRLELVKASAIILETIIVHKTMKKNKKLGWAITGAIVATNLVIAKHNKEVSPVGH